MDCCSELTYAIFVDGELAAEEARQVRNHLAACSRCREFVETLRAENRVLKAVLRELPEEAPGRPSVLLSCDYMISRGRFGRNVLSSMGSALVIAHCALRKRGFTVSRKRANAMPASRTGN